MIRITRDLEPPGLSGVRTDRLARARASQAAGQPIAFDAYDLVKPQLARMQHIKCCYCEKPEEQPKYRDVEHYRPKSVYWWLTWTWENLLFSCIDCNRERKRDQFPRADGDQALVAEEAPPGSEQPLVLDPSEPALDPTLHIEFRRFKIQGQERWQPFGITDRGKRTIEVCGLDRPGLLTLYKDHVNHRVRPKLELFAAVAVEGQREQAVFDAWDRMVRGLLAPALPFRALSYDAVNALTSSTVRARYRLVLARP